jgi:hypothetical protein
MYWKMSIDLTRPLVPSMGQHDPLDGCVTYVQLQETPRPPDSCPAPALDTAIADFGSMIDAERLATDDALGIGGLLVDAYRMAQLGRHDDLLEASLEAALAGLDDYAGWNLQTPLHARRRVAFRELGLAIGLAAVERMGAVVAPQLSPLVEELGKFAPLRSALERFWLQSENQRAETWEEHADISTVMLATSLVPDAFLTLHRPRGPGVSFLNPPESERGPRQTSHSA